METIAERGARLVAGNHDYGAIGRLDLGWFNAHARAAALWTASRLADDHRRFLAELPLELTIDDATLVHSSPKNPEEWEYLVTAEEGFEALRAFSGRLCFVGHSHRAGVWSLGSSGSDFEPRVAEIRLEPGRRYIVNVGSVGQPRDRDPRACYAVWDPEAGRVVFYRVPYDVALAREKILEAGLPRFLGDRLAYGG